MKSTNDTFIKSNKIIRFKLGVKEADILATLKYKYEYWKSRNETTKKKGYDCFFISREDIKAETTYGLDTITKAIKKLVNKGLVTKIQQGLNKPNLYSINESEITKFLEDHQAEYDKWRKSIFSKQSSEAIKNTGTTEYSVSRNCKNTLQETEKLHTTKNKNTYNRNTKNSFTDHLASSVETKPSEDFLEEQIQEFKDRMESNDQNVTSDFFSLLCNLVPQFRHFSMSEKDEDLITMVLESKMYLSKISSKLWNNAEKINNGIKKAEFRNLFTGLKKMNENCKSLVGGV